MSTPAARMSGAGKPGVELREDPFEYELHIFTNSAHRDAVNDDALRLQFHQGACADASDRNRVDLTSSQSL